MARVPLGGLSVLLAACGGSTVDLAPGDPGAGGGDVPDSAVADVAGEAVADVAGEAAADVAGEAVADVAGEEVAGSPVCEFSAIAVSGGKKLPIEAGDKVELQSTVELDSIGCTDPAGGTLECWWSCNGPEGDAGSFTPSAYFEKVAYPVDVVGDYELCLECESSSGGKGKECLLLTVEPPNGCHVELTWDTPLDPDETDMCNGCGSDLDLHVRHPYATGWYDVYFDCFWMNANPQDPRWCPHMSPVDPAMCLPHLDRDDTNGGGPENFTYAEAEADRCYEVGVHYWDDHDFGASYATVKVWIDGALVYESEPPTTLKMFGLWEVGTLCCAAGTFTPHEAPGGGPVVIPGYMPPDLG
jgi:hypothetical protein